MSTPSTKPKSQLRHTTCVEPCAATSGKSACAGGVPQVSSPSETSTTACLPSAGSNAATLCSARLIGVYPEGRRLSIRWCACPRSIIPRLMRVLTSWQPAAFSASVLPVPVP